MVLLLYCHAHRMLTLWSQQSISPCQGIYRRHSSHGVVKICMYVFSKEFVQVAQRQDRCVVVRLSTWKRVPFWHVNTLIPERALFVYPHPPSLVVLRPVLIQCVSAVCCGIQNLILFLKASGRWLRVAVLVLVLYLAKSVLWSFFGEGGPAPAQAQAREAYGQDYGGVNAASAREAPLVNNGGESRASTVTNEQRPLCHASPGREGVGQKTDEAGFEEIEENDTMSEGSFASAESQGHRTEEEETLTFEMSMIQLGWQNEELISDRWVKIADQPEVRVMQLTKRDDLEREDEGCSKIDCRLVNSRN